MNIPKAARLYIDGQYRCDLDNLPDLVEAIHMIYEENESAKISLEWALPEDDEVNLIKTSLEITGYACEGFISN